MPPIDRIQQVGGHLETPPDPILDPSRVDGHVIIITGGARGIGRAAASLLAQKGARIAISDVDAQVSEEACQELQKAGYETASFPGDMLDEAFPQKLVDDVIQKWGKINCLINNAGFTLDSAIHKMQDDQFDMVMKIHNYVPFRLLRALSSHWMDPVNKGMPKSIINVSSTSGLHGAMGQINYGTAKSGVVGMTKVIAAEWARYNVRANCIAYGWIDTRITRPPNDCEVLMVGGREIHPGIPLAAKKWRDVSDIPLGRPGYVHEAARVMLFLASPLSSYVTGTCVECTGGRFM